MTEKKNTPGTPDFVERRSGDRRRTDSNRRGPLRWDPAKDDRRQKKDRRKSVDEGNVSEVPPTISF